MTYDILVVRYGMMMPNNWSFSFVCNKGHGITSYLHEHQHSWPGQSYESVNTPSTLSTLSGTGSLGHLPCFHIFHGEMTMSAVRQAILANLGTSNAYFVDRYLGLWKTVIHDDGCVDPDAHLKMEVSSIKHCSELAVCSPLLQLWDTVWIELHFWSQHWSIFLLRYIQTSKCHQGNI